MAKRLKELEELDKQENHSRQKEVKHLGMGKKLTVVVPEKQKKPTKPKNNKKAECEETTEDDEDFDF